MLANNADALTDAEALCLLVYVAVIYFVAITGPVLACFKRTAAFGLVFGIVAFVFGGLLLLAHIHLAGDFGGYLRNLDIYSAVTLVPVVLAAAGLIGGWRLRS